jgi:hypothetical protein
MLYPEIMGAEDQGIFIIYFMHGIRQIAHVEDLETGPGTAIGYGITVMLVGLEFPVHANAVAAGLYIAELWRPTSYIKKIH